MPLLLSILTKLWKIIYALYQALEVRQAARLDEETIDQVKEVMPTLPIAINTLERLRNKVYHSNVSSKEFSSYTIEIRKTGYKAIIDANHVIENIVENSSDGAENSDCHSSGNIIFEACSKCLLIKESCGFYDQQLDKKTSVMKMELECCKAAQNVTILSCTNNPNTFVSGSAYITSAYMICGEVRGDQFESPLKTYATD